MRAHRLLCDASAFTNFIRIALRRLGVFCILGEVLFSDRLVLQIRSFLQINDYIGLQTSLSAITALTPLLNDLATVEVNWRIKGSWWTDQPEVYFSVSLQTCHPLLLECSAICRYRGCLMFVPSCTDYIGVVSGRGDSPSLHCAAQSL